MINTYVWFVSKEEAENYAKKAIERYCSFLSDVQWMGFGWYYVSQFNQPGPKGSTDDGIRAISAKRHADNIAEKIKELAIDLVEARSKY